MMANASGSLTSGQQAQVIPRGPISVLWDIENCGVPSDVPPEDVAGNIRGALRSHSEVGGVVTVFSAYGDFNSFSRRMREAFQRTGIKLVDVPNGRKDAADKAILVDMFLFALDNPPPSSIMLISGDVDFAPSLHILGQRGYTVILSMPYKRSNISSAMANASSLIWDWTTLSRCSAVMTSSSSSTETKLAGRSDEGPRQQSMDVTVPSLFSQHCSFPLFPQASRCVPSSSENQEEKDPFVKPGDLDGLKGQILKIIEAEGGTLVLTNLVSNYRKMFGRPLFLSEYGESKLINLVKKMEDVVEITVRGNTKLLNIRGSKESSAHVPFPEDIDMCAGEKEEALEGFKRDVQEILVSYSCRIFTSIFEEVYLQKYNKALEYWRFGVGGLDELLEMVGDVVMVQADAASQRRFLVPRSQYFRQL